MTAAHACVNQWNCYSVYRNKNGCRVLDKLTSSHWGIGVGRIENNKLVAVEAHASDPDPSPLNDNIVASLNGKARVLRPAIRKSWLDGKPGERGRDPYIEVDWDFALEILANELNRVRSAHGNEAIFAGSYGWSSAGRFHHAQSQLKRFLNTIGGFVRSEGNYSYNAALVAMPHIVGDSFRRHVVEATRWTVVAEHTELVVAFGGLAMRNMQICDGGASRHRMADNLAACVDRGVQFINVSPLKTDIDASTKAEWLAPRPGTDTAVMMGLAHTLMAEGLYNQAFLDRYTVGFDKVAAYLRGEVDGVAKDADWAAAISGLQAERIRSLAWEMASKRTMISCAAGLQRADWGEQPLWMTVTLAAMLGQIGLPGGGYTIGYAVNAHIGNITRPFRWGVLPQGDNPIETYIPVAMISELLLNPGKSYRYDGQTLKFPDTKLVWWAGGNPFHHHQDLNLLRRAFQQPDTIIVNEINWTATARHADIVLPASAPQERMDFGGGQTDNILVPMSKFVDPPGDVRTEFDIYCELAKRMGTFDAFTAGRDEAGWLEHLWAETREAAAAHGTSLPSWDAFMAGDIIEIPDPAPDQTFLKEFRDDPKQNPRQTPSGKIELYSETVAAFGLEDCAGHATWNPPRDLANGLAETYPLAMVSGQPGTRLHSQFDNGTLSRAAKVRDREPVLIHPKDAQNRGIEDGDIVEIFNRRGRCLAGARVTADVAEGVIFLWTGAWYDPDLSRPDNLDRHGNPNVLTHDQRTSEFSQSPASHSAYVDIAKYEGTAPAVRAFDPPTFADPINP